MIAARLACSLQLSFDQCWSKPFDRINSRFDEPLSDCAKNLRIWLVHVVKARRVNKDNRMAIGGMSNSDGSNIFRERPQSTANGLTIMTGSTFDKLQRWSPWYWKWVRESLTVLFPAPVGPMTLRDINAEHELFLNEEIQHTLWSYHFERRPSYSPVLGERLWAGMC